MFTKIKLAIIPLFFNYSFCQDFVPIDNETFEFIEDVNYNLFSNKVNVFSSVCNNDKVTSLPKNISFDSISFNKVNYQTLGLKKVNISKTVLLTKSVFTIEEIIVSSSKKQDIILGEENRFVKRQSNSISKEMLYGIVIKNQLNSDLEINKILFYIDKVKYKTAYKLNFHEYNQVPISIGHQYAEIGKLLFSTDILYLEAKQKDAVEIPLEERKTILKEESVFVTLELISYYDENNNIIVPSFKDSTKLKFQLSNQTNYYAKMVNSTTGELTSKLININALINYDFAYQFFSKPHKSSIVAPAILLYAQKLEK